MSSVTPSPDGLKASEALPVVLMLRRAEPASLARIFHQVLCEANTSLPLPRSLMTDM